MSTTIAEDVNALHQGMAGQMPPDIMSAFITEQTALDQAGAPSAAQAGETMPNGPLLDAHGHETTLSQACAGQPAVIVFYRGEWCPYCNTALRNYQANLVPQLKERNVKLIAISPQKADGSLTMAEKLGLSFTVLSDPGNGLAQQLGVFTAPTAEALSAQRTIGLDLPSRNIDGTAGLPMPTVVLVDADGIVRWIDIHPNYTTRTEVVDIVAALDANRM